jgi:predicted phage terminase large subunit-like protein
MKIERDTQEELLQLINESKRRKYNNDFYSFFKDAWEAIDPYTELQENWHITYLIWIAQFLTEDVLNKVVPKHTTVLINVPPRSLKSWVFNQALPVWIWTKAPSLPLMTISYSEELAHGFSRKSQEIIKSNWFKNIYGTIFSIDPSSGGREAVGETQTNKGGVRLSTGTGGSTVGKGFMVGIIDDPIKTTDITSKKELDTNLNFWKESFDTRRNDAKKAIAFVIMQRLAEGDMAGYLIETYGDDPDFLHINLPAVQDGTEKIPYLEQFIKAHPEYKNQIYKRGYLFGDRFDESFIRKVKKKGAIFWATQYQQNPLPSEGLLFKREWFKTITQKDFNLIDRTHRLKRTFVTDTAYTANTLNDGTGLLTYTIHGNTIYITDYVDGYIDAADLPNWIEKNVNRAGYDNKKSLITIEPKGSGKVVVSLLKKLTNLNVVEYQYPRAAKVNINIKKEERAEAIVPMVESNRVILVEGDWNEKFISQVTTFPLAKSDEAVDCLVMAVLRAHYVDSRYKKYAVKRNN